MAPTPQLNSQPSPPPTPTPEQPITDDQRAWFKQTTELAARLHAHSHTFPRGEDNLVAVELARTFQALCDLQEFLTSTSSWEDVALHVYDLRDFSEKFNRLFTMRLVVQNDNG